MKKEMNRFERITDGVFFAVDTRVFESTITHYDPMVANSTLITSQRQSDEIVADDNADQAIDEPTLDS